MPKELNDFDFDENDICSDGGEHKPDWSTLKITYDGEYYVDINCDKCGRSGCVGSEKTLAEDISW